MSDRMGDHLDRRTLDKVRHGVRLVGLKLVEADFLPENVGALGHQKVRRTQCATCFEQRCCLIRADLLDHLFDDDARIDDEISHKGHASNEIGGSTLLTPFTL